MWDRELVFPDQGLNRRGQLWPVVQHPITGLLVDRLVRIALAQPDLAPPRAEVTQLSRSIWKVAVWVYHSAFQRVGVYVDDEGRLGVV